MSKIFDIIDIDEVEKLADIVSKNDLGEITVSYDDKTISVKGRKLPPPPPAAAGTAPAAVGTAPADDAGGPLGQPGVPTGPLG